jgi:carboxyvinyl-carboxyphosphonate phosphorylmutase
MPAPKSLREQISSGKMVIAPGAYDCITARLIEQAGFSAVYMTGAGTSATLGYPDYGLVTMSEMVENARRLGASINVPLISDADTGYGNELNMYRTVQEFERAGVTAIHVEDQVFPKKCGHLDNKELVSLDDYLAKIRAAVAARRSRDFLIIARTDSRTSLGIDEAIRRGQAFAKAGADIVFIEAPETEAEMTAVVERIDAPVLFNLVHGGRTPMLPASKLAELGTAIAIYPAAGFLATAAALESSYSDIRDNGGSTGRAPMYSFDAFTRLMGFPEIWEFEKRYGLNEPQA